MITRSPKLDSSVDDVSTDVEPQAVDGDSVHAVMSYQVGFVLCLFARLTSGCQKMLSAGTVHARRRSMATTTVSSINGLEVDGRRRRRRRRWS